MHKSELLSNHIIKWKCFNSLQFRRQCPYHWCTWSTIGQAVITKHCNRCRNPNRFQKTLLKSKCFDSLTPRREFKCNRYKWLTKEKTSRDYCWNRWWNPPPGKMWLIKEFLSELFHNSIGILFFYDEMRLRSSSDRENEAIENFQSSTTSLFTDGLSTHLPIDYCQIRQHK
jgi:hypothetical protein